MIGTKRPRTVKLDGKVITLDPQVYYNSKGYCLLTIAAIEERELTAKKTGNTFNVVKLKLQFRGYDGMGVLTDQLSFVEDIGNENFLVRGEHTLKARIYDALGIRELAKLEVAEEIEADVNVDIKANVEAEDEGFFDEHAALDDEIEIETVQEQYRTTHVLPGYIGKSFIAIITRDNTKTGKYSNEGYLSIVGESIKPVPTRK